MDIYVYSRQALDAARPHDVPHLVISITSSPDDVASLRSHPARLGVLRLSFPDVELPSELYAEGVLFSREHATQVWAFVEEHRAKVERIIVHCDAGKSRSPAVAAALARVLDGDDASTFGGRYHASSAARGFARQSVEARPAAAKAAIAQNRIAAWKSWFFRSQPVMMSPPNAPK